MQNLTRLIGDAKKKAGMTDQNILNMIREYLQVLILKAIYQSKYGSGLSFIGGTCLRICYNLKRYSEDLDFTLDRNISNYSFRELNEIIISFLKNSDFEVDLNVSEDKVVQKSFIRVKKVLHVFGLSPMKSQKLYVKLAVDTNPVKLSASEIETFFVSKFNEMFPVLKHTDATLFAGKICACLYRVYTKGRDFYDLLWYLNKKQDINFVYLNKSLEQAGMKKRFQNREEVTKELEKRIEKVDVNNIMQDIGRFLEDAGEEEVLKSYHAAFKQAADKFLQ